MLQAAAHKQRSLCPVSAALDIFGDKWSLLIIRDAMVRGYRTFREFQAAGEGIATNILTDRLYRLQTADLLTTETDARDGRLTLYRLTPKGIALAPVLLELLIWGARHEHTAVPPSVLLHMEQNRAALLAEAYRRWEQRDPTPLIPPFTSPAAPAKGYHP
ncbi:MAG TPA: helix-turn-helix domain-containing protein [Acetobacteraceae bacterium]|nr:helix-turn-helix domain-containing protein [Acetobacteraceae bacterium]